MTGYPVSIPAPSRLTPRTPRIAKLIAHKKARLWINHDLSMFNSLKHSPEYYD